MATSPILINVPTTPPSSSDISDFDTRADVFLSLVQAMSVAIQDLSTNTYNNGAEARDTRLTYIGDWSGVTAYVVGNVVTYNSKVYQCSVGHTNQTPNRASIYWAVVIEPGNSYNPELLSVTVGGSVTTTTALLDTRKAVSANNIDCITANTFTKTIAANTTFTVSNVASAGYVTSFVLELTNGGAYTITWWSGMKWSYGIAPTLTASGTDILMFYTYDGGTTWRGLLVAKDER